MRRQFVHKAELFESHCLFSKKYVIALRQSRISPLRLFIKQTRRRDAGLFKNELFYSI